MKNKNKRFFGFGDVARCVVALQLLIAGMGVYGDEPVAQPPLPTFESIIAQDLDTVERAPRRTERFEIGTGIEQVIRGGTRFLFRGRFNGFGDDRRFAGDHYFVVQAEVGVGADQSSSADATAPRLQRARITVTPVRVSPESLNIGRNGDSASSLSFGEIAFERDLAIGQRNSVTMDLLAFQMGSAVRGSGDRSHIYAELAYVVNALGYTYQNLVPTDGTVAGSVNESGVHMMSMNIRGMVGWTLNEKWSVEWTVIDVSGGASAMRGGNAIFNYDAHSELTARFRRPGRDRTINLYLRGGVSGVALGGVDADGDGEENDMSIGRAGTISTGVSIRFGR